MSTRGLKQVQSLQHQLLDYVVLDPACGSGNFLYTAYRELRRIERQLHDRESELRRAEGRRGAEQGALATFFPLTNIKGIELDAFAVSLARVTLWMGHKLAVDELDLDEATLPLGDLSGIRTGDALRVPWPKASVIVGNPPFHGDRNLRGLLGGDYVEWLKREFGCGVKDHCVYWFRKAHDHLDPGQRAGLVGTNSIAQNRARSASLNYVVEHDGVITDAVSTQDWPGEASVHVSIVNWVKSPASLPSRFVLDEAEVEAIDSALTESTVPVADVPVLAANRGVAFQGVIPRGDGFVLDRQEGEQLLDQSGAGYLDVVRPYLGGKDITTSLDRVKPKRDLDPAYAAMWWQLWRPRPAFRAAARQLERFIAGTATGKRILFTWCPKTWCVSNAANVFALDSDYAMGVLTSRVHTDWAAGKSSTLESRIRYTPGSAFETFPWPQPTDVQREAISERSRNVMELRASLCEAQAIGLTTLYNRVDDGAFVELRRSHVALDRAVLAAYGWGDDHLDDVRLRNRSLFDRNAEIVSGAVAYQPF